MKKRMVIAFFATSLTAGASFAADWPPGAEERRADLTTLHGLVIDNRKAVHGRSFLSMSVRWLMRLFLLVFMVIRCLITHHMSSIRCYIEHHIID